MLQLDQHVGCVYNSRAVTRVGAHISSSDAALSHVQLAYKFGELVEVHAADTYAEFVEANEVRALTCLVLPLRGAVLLQVHFQLLTVHLDRLSIRLCRVC